MGSLNGNNVRKNIKGGEDCVMERRPQGLFIMFTSASSDVAY